MVSADLMAPDRDASDAARPIHPSLCWCRTWR